MKQNPLKNILYVLYFIIFIDNITILFLSPILPALLLEITGKHAHETTLLAGFIAAGFSLSQFLFAPFIGKLSDKYGRKPILLLAISLFMVDYFIMALTNNIYMLIIARLISGISGGSVVVVTTCISDLFKQEERVKYYSYLFGIGSLSMVIGPGISGFLSTYSIRAPMWMAFIICAINLVMIILFVPETNNIRHTGDNSKVQGNSSTIKQILSYNGFLFLFCGQFLILFCIESFVLLLPFYLKIKFSLNEVNIAFVICFSGAIEVITQFFIAERIHTKWGAVNTIILGGILFVAGSIILAVTDNLLSIYVAVFIFSLGFMTGGPTINTFSSNVKEHEQGLLQGILASINCAGGFIGLIVGSFLYSFFIENKFSQDGGVFFIVTCMILSIGFLSFYIGMKKVTAR